MWSSTSAPPGAAMVSACPLRCSWMMVPSHGARSVSLTGSMATQDKGYADRSTMREVMGSNVLQELVLR